MATFQDEWLTVNDTIRQRGLFMFNNDLLSDVSLVVPSSSDEGEPTAKKTKMAIPAHKVVLSLCSPVFFAMFCGKMTSSQMTLRSKSVDLPDCEYEGVLEMLRYMYSERAQLNENSVMQVLYVAKKYIVKSLADKCIEFLQSNVEPENVFCVLSHAQQYDEKVLVDQCWEVIDRETEQVVTSEGFATIEKSLLEEIVKRDTLTIREEELFKAVDLWATKECERQGLTVDGSVKRRILGETIVEQIRFPVMEQKEFASVILDSEMLTPQEVVNMMKHFNSVLTSPVSFRGDKRIGALQSCFRYGGVGIGPHHYMNLTERIHFTVNKDVVFHGICLFGRNNNEYEVTLTVRKSHGSGILVRKSGKFSPVPKRNKGIKYFGYDVMLAPISLSKDTQYYIKAKIKGPDSWHGVMGSEEVTSHHVTFSFERCHQSNNTLFSGQFADILFKLV